MAKRKHSENSRDFTKGDDVYNARRREVRAAQRYYDEANESSGATRKRNLMLAREHYERALETYAPGNKQKLSAPIRKLGAELGIDTNKRRAEFEAKSEAAQKRELTLYEKKRKTFEERSLETLESNLKDTEYRKEKESKVLLNSIVGKRILAGLVDVWGEYAGDREAVTKSIFDYLNVDNWSDVIAKIEKAVGDSLYSVSGEDDFYEIVKTAIQTMVVDNSLIAA